MKKFNHYSSLAQASTCASLDADIVCTTGSKLLIFDNQIYEDNNCYNNTTGQFRAPISGIYCLKECIENESGPGGAAC